MKLSAKHLLVGLALLAALVFFYFKTNQVIFAEHDRFSQNVRHLKQVDATLNQDVLKSRLHLLTDYDRFPELMAELRETIRNLGAIPSFVSPSEGEWLRTRINELSILVSEKEREQERFKSQNATLNGSLRYLPITGANLIRLCSTEDEDLKLRAILNQLIRQVLIYGLNSHEDQAAEIRQSLEELESWSSAHSGDPRSAELKSLASHARSIVLRKPKLEEVTRKIVTVPLDDRAEEVLGYYNGLFSVAMRAAGHYRLSLYLLCGLLVLSIGYTLFALDKANTNLESRVVARTHDLSGKNDQLQREVAERVRAERQLGENERRLRLILESEPECVMLVDEEGMIMELNPAGLKMMEAAGPFDAVGRAADDFVAPEFQSAFRDLNEAVFRGESKILEFEIVGMKGTRRWMETHACPLRNAEGAITAHLAVVRDVTQRKRTDAELAYERDLLRTLLENCPDQIYFKDRDSRFIKCSQTIVERFQRSMEQLLGSTDSDYFDAGQAAPRLEDEQRIIQTGEPLVGKIERDLSHEDGTVRWVITTKAPLRDKSGTIIGTFGISKDVTAIKLAEARLEEVNRQLIDTSRQAGMAEVATNVLHNVGNVLNSVNVSCSMLSTAVRKSSIDNVTRAAGLLRENEADLGTFFAQHPAGKKLPNYLQRLSERLIVEQESLLRELAVLSENVVHIKEIVAMQQNYGKVSGVREVVSAVDLLEESLRINADSLVRHKVQPIREYASSPPVLVEKHKVQMILVNLIRNAKFACQEADRDDRQIRLSIVDGGGHVRISVSDNGVGIPRENLIRIFQHGFTTRKDGHGYGLHSAVLVARELGGSLVAHSDGLGHGSTFTLELPVKSIARAA